MKTTILAGIAVGCLALSGAAIAGETARAAQGKPAPQRDPMQASASISHAAAVPVRYDSGCRAQYGFGSNGYHGCLQRLPATALVGGN